MWDTLIPVIVGGVMATAGGVLAEVLKHRLTMGHNSRALAGALAGEIGALCAIARNNLYLEGLELRLEHATGGHMPEAIVIPATANYMAVYQAGVGQLGHLPAVLAQGVARYYTQVNSLLESVRPDSPKPRNLEEATYQLQHLIALLRRTLTLGDELAMRLVEVSEGKNKAGRASPLLSLNPEPEV